MAKHAKEVQGVPDDEFNRVVKYVLAKARRYKLPTVHLSDVMIHGWNDEQRDELARLVNEAGYMLKLGRHVYGLDLSAQINRSKVPRFGVGSRGEQHDHMKTRRDDYGYPPLK